MFTDGYAMRFESIAECVFYSKLRGDVGQVVNVNQWDHENFPGLWFFIKSVGVAKTKTGRNGLHFCWLLNNDNGMTL